MATPMATPMVTYVALLRGVNVGGNTLKMDRLRAICAELGLGDARTYLQSGNIVFEARGPSSRWSQALERALAGQSRLPVAVILRSAAQMARVVADNPILREPGIEPARLYVTFLRQAPTPTGLAALNALNDGPDRLLSAGAEIYLHCPGGYGRTRLSNNAIERALKVEATTRNWNTVKALLEMSAIPKATAAAPSAAIRKRGSGPA
jgi:uncharacterized protein (DUF1697 family)